MNIDPLKPERLACEDAIRHLNAFLDGDAPELTASIREHRQTCQACQEEWAIAQIFQQPLKTRPMSPANLADRTYAAVNRDVARRRFAKQLGWLSFATAAGIIVGIVIWQYGNQPTIDRVPVIAEVTPTQTATRDDSIKEVRLAMAEITEKLIPESPKVNLDAETGIKFPMVEPLVNTEPVVHTLNDASEGLKTGVQPITSSAKRAFNMLFRATESLPKTTVNPKVR